MAKEKVITVMCAARLPEMLVARIDSAAASCRVSRAQFIAEACRMRLDGEGSSVVEPGPSKADVAGSIPAPRSKPDMRTLREICAGNRFADLHGNMEGVEPRIANEIPICGKQWWEDGNHYECLMDKGHKEPKHGLGGVVMVVE